MPLRFFNDPLRLTAPSPSKGSRLSTFTHTTTPDELAGSFDRLDTGDESQLIDLDILLDLPEVASVARLHFKAGVGYEVVTSQSADHGDLCQVVSLVGHARLIRQERWGTSTYGEPQWRSLYWEGSAGVAPRQRTR